MDPSSEAVKSKERQRDRSPLGLPHSRWQPYSSWENEFCASINSQTQSDKKKGRAAIFEFDTNALSNGKPFSAFEPHPKHFFSAAEFRGYVAELRRSKDPKRCLIILEDLGSDWVYPLMRDLDVPQDVFAQHWAGPAYHSEGRARVPLGQDPHRHYILSYEQPHAITIEIAQKGLTHHIDCNASRSISFSVTELNSKEDPRSKKREKKRKEKNDELDPTYTSRQLVSFWASEEILDGSRISLLLVDPPLRSLNPEKPDDLTHSIYTQDIINGVRLVREYPEVHRNNAHIEPLPRLSKGYRWGEYEGPALGNPPLGHSMFDDLCSMEQMFPSRNPSSAAYPSRRLLLARTAATFQGAFADAYRLALSSSAGIPLSDEMSSLDYAELEKKAWNSKWEGRRFTKLWEQRENLELLRHNLRQNIQVIERLSLNPEEIAIEIDSPTLDHESVQLIKKGFYRQQQNDLREWQELDKTADYINQVIVRTTESYLQTVQARESQASNFQAMSVGRLTKMATIFVPVSLAAAIFSMGGNFAAGDAKFWIFWVVSLPIVGLLILWMFGRSFWIEVKRLQEEFKNSSTWRRMTGNLKIGPAGVIHDEEYARQVQEIKLKPRPHKRQESGEREVKTTDTV